MVTLTGLEYDGSTTLVPGLKEEWLQHEGENIIECLQFQAFYGSTTTPGLYGQTNLLLWSPLLASKVCHPYLNIWSLLLTLMVTLTDHDGHSYWPWWSPLLTKMVTLTDQEGNLFLPIFWHFLRYLHNFETFKLMDKRQVKFGNVWNTYTCLVQAIELISTSQKTHVSSFPNT